MTGKRRYGNGWGENSMSHKKQTLCLFMLTVLFALSACASEQNAASELPKDDTAAEPSIVTARSAKIVRLGSSPYALRIANELSPLRISNGDWADDMVASYCDNAKLLNFSVYQFSKAGYPDTLKEFVEQEAKEYEATDIVTDIAVNGIPAGYYRSTNNYDGVFRDGVTYAFESEDEYIEVDFWFIGYQSEEKAKDIINTLAVVESDVLPLSGYQILLPKDFTLISAADANPAVYESGNMSLYLYVSRFPAAQTSLADFVRAEARRKNGSNIETDAEINGIPVASYCAVEAMDGAFRSTLTCVLEGNGDFTALTFRLDGITAEDEAANILNTLSLT